MIAPYFEQDGIVIFNARCEDVFPQLAAGSIDLVFTSPPYNLGMSASGPAERGSFYLPSVTGAGQRFRNGYGAHDDCMPWDEYITWQKETLRQCWRVLVDDGAIFYNHKPRQMHKAAWLPLVLNPDLPLRQIITWDRGGGVGLSDAHFCSAYEWIMVFAKPAFGLTGRKASAMTDVWRVPFESQRVGHPAPFPLALPARAIRATAPSVLLDPFSGTGTSLRAAKDAGIQAIGIEISEEYCDIAARRLSQQVFNFEVPV